MERIISGDDGATLGNPLHSEHVGPNKADEIEREFRPHANPSTTDAVHPEPVAACGGVVHHRQLGCLPRGSKVGTRDYRYLDRLLAPGAVR